MSTQTTTEPSATADQLSSTRPQSTAGPIQAVPFSRIVRVEMRKQIDTLAGRWLLVAIAAIIAIVVAVLLFTGDGDRGWMDYLSGTTTPLSILLPVLAIMAATSEWSQRTAMTTFTLEPRRGRMIGAKVVSSLLFGLFVYLLAVAFGALAHLGGIGIRGAESDWALNGWLAGGMLIVLVVGLVQGSAFGLALLNTPAAIVAYLALPTAMSLVGALIPSWQDALAWVDINQTLTPFISGVEPSAEQWQQVAVSVAIWVAVPMAIGVWRVLHREVK